MTAIYLLWSFGEKGWKVGEELCLRSFGCVWIYVDGHFSVQTVRKEETIAFRDMTLNQMPWILSPVWFISLSRAKMNSSLSQLWNLTHWLTSNSTQRCISKCLWNKCSDVQCGQYSKNNLLCPLHHWANLWSQIWHQNIARSPGIKCMRWSTQCLTSSLLAPQRCRWDRWEGLNPRRNMRGETI